MKEFYTYILKCNDDSYYTGHTDDLDVRLSQHIMGEPKCYTSTRLPVKLAYHATFPTRQEALEAERKIKKWSRKKKEALIEENWDAISKLAKKKFKKK